MSTMRNKSEVSLDTLLTDVAQLDTHALDNFADQVLALRAKRRAPCLPKDEATLLQQINQGLTPTIQQRYDALEMKRRAETLSSNEYQELLALIDQIEQEDARRVRSLALLAQHRHVSITTLMDELGIQRPDYA